MRNMSFCMLCFVLICTNSSICQIDSAYHSYMNDSTFIVAQNFHYSDFFGENRSVIPGLMDGKYVDYNTDSTQTVYFRIRNFAPDGEVIYFENKKVFYTGYYDQGQMNGLWTYYTDGSKNKEYYYDHNVWTEWKTFYHNGLMDSTRVINMPRKNNKRVYYYTRYHKNGNKMVDGLKIDDKKQNKWQYWYSSGILEKDEFYKNGQRHGLSYEYDTLGILSQTVKYRNDRIIKQFRFINKTIDDVVHNVTIKSRNGNIIKTTIVRYSDGNFTTEVIRHRRKGNGWVTVDDENGIPHKRLRMKKNKFEIYSPTGF